MPRAPASSSSISHLPQWAESRPQRVAFRFVLGLILMRKKLLKFTGRKSPDGHAVETGTAEPAGGTRREIWLMQPRGTSPETLPVELVNPDLSEEDVRDLLDQLSEILHAEL